MLKRLSRRKGKKEEKEDTKKEVDKGLLKEITLETQKEDQDNDEKEEVKETSVIDASDLEIEETESKLFISKDESINAIINTLLDSLEESITDEKIFEISQVVRESVEKRIQELISHLESKPSVLSEDEFIYNRLSSLTKSLAELVEKTQQVNEFDTLILSLNTLLSQSLISKIKDNGDSTSVDLSKANLLEVEEPIKKGEEIITYVDNRDHDTYAKSTSVISEEQLKEIEEAEEKEKEELKETKVDEAREYLEQSARIREALKEKSTYLVSGKFRYLSMDERLEIEKEQFKSKFLSYVRKPSVYEMSVYELQKFASQKGLKNFEGMSRDELLAFVENPLRLYGEKYITQNPYINRLKIELADNAALKDDILLAEAKINESLKAAKAYSKSVKTSAITWQAFFIITLILVAAAIVGILVYFLAF